MKFRTWLSWMGVATWAVSMLRRHNFGCSVSFAVNPPPPEPAARTEAIGFKADEERQ